MRAYRVLLALLSVVGPMACAPAQRAAPIPAPPPAAAPLARAPTLMPARPSEVGMDDALNVRLDSLAAAAIADSAAPAIAIAVGRYGRLVHLRGYGRVDWVPGASLVDADSTLFDLASVTKVVATTTAAAILEDEGRLNLDRPVRDYLPELDDPAKAGITVRMLLTHRGGFEAFAPLYREFRGRIAYLRQINARPLAYPPGTKTVYSDWDMVLMQLVIERITGEPLDGFTQRRVFAPLGMRETRFNPAPTLRQRTAATEVDPVRGLIWGSVHDPNAFALGGVAGHAGLFSTARDVAVFAQMMLSGGEYGGARILRPQTVARWTAPQNDRSSRALGWDTPSGRSSAGRFFGPRSFGHTGYTGTSLWMDPERGLFVVVLTNRVNPTSENQKHIALRRAIADAAQQAVLDAPLIDWEVRRGAADSASLPR